jgi:sigma-54 specific flagellar transcriptional regulator A
VTPSVDDIIIGQSAPVRELKRLIEVVAGTKTNVLVLGETGTGKELVARALHAHSGRKGKLVSVNCAAIPSELLESELFGHEKGSFTGADKARAGRFEMAKGGTLFLDEIGDMPLPLQSKLLRALENRTIQRVGGGDEVPVDFRLICATHQKIEQKVDEGSFRADLYFRINVFPVLVPSLAERSVDVPLIAEAILNQMITDQLVVKPKLDDTAWQELSRYPWPGNVRELRNVLERATVLFAGQVITGTHIRENLLRLKVPDRKEEQDALWAASEALLGIDVGETNAEMHPLPHPAHYTDWFSYFDTIDLRRHLRDVEVVLIEAALEKSGGMVSHAANALKLQRTTLIEKMKKLMIERPAGPKSGVEDEVSP